jgi:hypothetical protein
MALQCNIDARGKAVRLVIGILASVGGAGLLVFWAWKDGGWVPWITSMILIAYGAFAVFEGCAGWCVVRAMGFKTRL